MYARVTLLEIDTVRTSVEDALWTFETQTVERLRAQPGYRGVWAMASPEGKGLLMSLWDTEAEASIEGEDAFYAEEIGRFMTLFRSPPGRERYEVLYIDEAAAETR